MSNILSGTSPRNTLNFQLNIELKTSYDNNLMMNLSGLVDGFNTDSLINLIHQYNTGNNLGFVQLLDNQQTLICFMAFCIKVGRNPMHVDELNSFLLQHNIQNNINIENFNLVLIAYVENNTNINVGDQLINFATLKQNIQNIKQSRLENVVSQELDDSSKLHKKVINIILQKFNEPRMNDYISGILYKKGPKFIEALCTIKPSPMLDELIKYVLQHGIISELEPKLFETFMIFAKDIIMNKSNNELVNHIESLRPVGSIGAREVIYYHNDFTNARTFAEYFGELNQIITAEFLFNRMFNVNNDKKLSQLFGDFTLTQLHQLIISGDISYKEAFTTKISKQYIKLWPNGTKLSCIFIESPCVL